MSGVRPICALALLLFGVAFGGCAEAGTPYGAPGTLAPDFSAPDLRGDTISIAELRDEVVLFNIWATWCAPCREEMPDLQAIEDDFGGDAFRVVGVSIDQSSADRAVHDFVERHSIDFMILRDPRGTVQRTFRTIGVPETYLIDGEGVVRARWIGQIDAGVVRAAVTDALEAG